MQIVIVGAGGIGGFLAAHLAPTPHGVHLIARGAHLDAIRARGLRFLRPDGTETTVAVPASDDFAAVAAADVVFICVKTFQLRGVLDALGRFARPGALVVTTQNGVEAPFVAAAALPEQIIVPGVVKVVALIEDSGVIGHVGGAGTVVVGDLEGHPGSAAKVQAALADGAVHADVTDDVLGELWKKFVFVAPFGGLGAVTGADHRGAAIAAQLAGITPPINDRSRIVGPSTRHRVGRRRGGANDEFRRLSAAPRHQLTATRHGCGPSLGA